jgi:serine protease inhibitor
LQITNQHNDLRNKAEGCKIVFANKVLVDKNVKVLQSYSQVLENIFGASSQNLDFLNPAAVIAVNDWVAEQTCNMIKNLVQTSKKSLVHKKASEVF